MYAVPMRTRLTQFNPIRTHSPTMSNVAIHIQDGVKVAAKSKPDGYTLLYVSPNEQAIAQAIGLKPAYNAEKDFSPITQFLRRPAVLVATPSLKVRTVAELVA
ncbi:MAG: tripartite tricarboxylate transporter substrate-binding protein, partial [Burkholderiales bacterium]